MLFELLLAATALVLAVAMIYAYRASRDLLHPVVLLSPLFFALYVWMPFRLLREDALNPFFFDEQLVFVQLLNFLAISAFLLGGLSQTFHWKSWQVDPQPITSITERYLLVGACLIGAVGLGAWVVGVRNVGGVTEAFSHAYSGGWDDNGYVRDATLLMFPAVMLAITVIVRGTRRVPATIIAAVFLAPWAFQALFTARRGPTYVIAITLLTGYCLNRIWRPPVAVLLVGSLVLGYFILFLVTNRQKLYIGSDFDVSFDVTDFEDTPDTGNEFIYGSGTVIDSDITGHHFWGKRYLAQFVVRPVPSAIWPTKYEDFGIPEMRENAGNGADFLNTVGWEGAPGSAPGIVADLWVEFWWIAVPVLFIFGRAYSWVWRNAVIRGDMWSIQYSILAALSLYFVMQTMEAVIFRFLMLSIPVWITWFLAKRRERLEYLAEAREQIRRNYGALLPELRVN